MGNEFIYVGVADVLEVVDEVAHTVSVDRVSEPHLGFDLVTLGDCDLTHVVAEAGNLQTLPIVPGTRRPQPGCKLAHDIFVLPESDDHLAPHASAACEKAELAIAMRRLVQI